MGLEIIGAGLGRTATLSLKRALEILGFGPCHHMAEIVQQPARAAEWALAGRGAAAGGQTDWDALFAGYRSTVDWPAATWWRELAAHWPDARIILSVRSDADSWFESTQRTIFHPDTLGAPMPDSFRDMIASNILHLFDGSVHDRARCIAFYESHNRAVQDAFPADRLLVYPAGSGWEPLCAFLGCPVPDQPYPRSNDAEEFGQMTGQLDGSAQALAQ